MALTPETLSRHELVGLRVEVVDSTNPDRIGIAGRVVRETMQTLHVEVPGDGDQMSRIRQVPKAEATFEFALTDEAAGRLDDQSGPRHAARDGAREGPGTTSEPATAADEAAEPGEGAAYVTVDGARLLSRPAERTETRGDTKWESD